MILLIDNYDSFTYNVFHYFASEGVDVKVYRNDQITIEDISELSPEAIVISPGPGTPDHAGLSKEIVKAFYKQIPILGICLGHQIIANTLGASIIQASTIKHGKTSMVSHNENGLFSYLPQPLEVMRYHSLVIDRATLPDVLKVTSNSLDDNEVMAIKHEQYPVYGIQFHPESIGTITGQKMIRNFLDEIGEESRYEKLS